MIDVHFVILGSLLNFIGGATYIYQVFKGQAKPNRVSWLLWGLAPMIAFIAEIKQGVGLQALLTFTVGFNPLLVVIASLFNKKSKWEITRFDLICGGLSLLGLLLWGFTKVGNVAILLSIMSNALAGIPTLIKSFKYPETESPYVFILGGTNGLITLLTIRLWNFENFAFPLYIFLFDFTMILLVKFQLGKKISNIRY